MSEDLIGRSDAIKAIANLHILADEEKIFKAYADNPHSMTTDFEGTLIDAINAIKGIPTIEPKRGEWEEKETFSVTDDDPIIERWQSARCSMCERYHTTPYMYYFNNYNFCPNCGADMRGKDNE